MMRFVYLLFFCALACSSEAQAIEVQNTVLPVPAGNVIGAAFAKDGDYLILQQVVVSLGEVLSNQSHRRLVKMDLVTGFSSITRDFPLTQDSGMLHPCGRIESIKREPTFVICSAESFLEVLDSNTLQTARQIGAGEVQNIYDFSVDENRDRVYVVSLRSDQSMHLSLYAFEDGRLIKDITISSGAWGGVMLALDAGRGGVVASEAHQAEHANQGNLYYCQSEPTLHCQSAIKVRPVSQMAFLGGRLLLVTSDLATSAKDCIESADLNTGEITKAYCSQGTGVHYAMGVVDKQYIAGFTGVEKVHPFLEKVTSKNASISIWPVDNHAVAAKAQDLTDYGTSQYELRIVSSDREPQFITFVKGGNTVKLYSITCLHVSKLCQSLSAGAAAKFSWRADPLQSER